MIVDLVFQLLQMSLVIAVAPLLTGLVRVTKARLLRRRGPPLFVMLSGHVARYGRAARDPVERRKARRVVA